MELQIRQSPLLARFAFPDKGRLVLSPGRQVAVEAVIRDIDLAADKPLGKWSIPLKHRVPFFEPIQLSCLLSPKSLRVGLGLGVELFVFGEALDVSFRRKFRRRREDAVFVQCRFDGDLV